MWRWWGAGPVGLEIGVALKRAGIQYLHFDAKQIGYTISWFAPQNPVLQFQ